MFQLTCVPGRNIRRHTGFDKLLRKELVLFIYLLCYPSPDTVRNILSAQGVLLKKHLLGGVKKGAFSLEEAEKRFQAWLTNKQSATEAIKEKVKDAKVAEAKKRLEAEKEVNKNIAEAVAKKKAEKAAAEAEAAAQAAAEAAPVEEAPAAEAPAAEQNAE